MKSYYLQQSTEGHPELRFVWEIEGDNARRMDSNIEHSAHPGEDILSILSEKLPFSTLTKMDLAPGEYFPRMARPDYSSDSPGFNPDEGKEFLYARKVGAGQLYALVAQLGGVCQVVHPQGRNLKAYGHEIRNILLLACTGG